MGLVPLAQEDNTDAKTHSNGEALSLAQNVLGVHLSGGMANESWA